MTVAAVVVCYEPDLDELKVNLARVAPQVDFLFLVDNSEPGVDLSVFYATQVFSMGVNKGIGWAHNIGIRAAIESGADRVLLLDQDSFIEPHTVQILSEALDVHPKCAAVGPQYLELNSEQVSRFVQIEPFWQSRTKTVCAKKYCDVDALISSGMLIRSSAYLAVGEMREDYFIDYVDTEWCFRAKAHGFQLLGLNEVLMNHRIGAKSVRLWFGVWRQVPIHMPGRYYFLFRNALDIVFKSQYCWFSRLYIFNRMWLYLLLLAFSSAFEKGSLDQAFAGIMDGV